MLSLHHGYAALLRASVCDFASTWRVSCTCHASFSTFFISALFHCHRSSGVVDDSADGDSSQPTNRLPTPMKQPRTATTSSIMPIKIAQR
mmetsp:Transcript_18172/g.52006  ORF Transcript_18172/g.52006 Transcript_18172/m.52006 type:complete len:90 (+) Transcript_18172:4318-4587(+)